MTASVSPRAGSPLHRRDLDETIVGCEKVDEARGSSSYHRVGTRPSGGRSGVRGRAGGVGFGNNEAAAATADGASYAFPVTVSSPPRAEGGGTRGRGGEFVVSVASSPRAMPGRTWRSLSPSPRTAATPGWPSGGAVSSAR